MKATISIAASMNGYIATDSGEEDFLSDDNWEISVEIFKEYKNVIWGRKAYETVLSWGEKYIRDLDEIKIIVLSKSDYKPNRSNVHFCKTPQEVLSFLEENNIEKALISGGTEIYTSFLNSGLVDDIIVNFNSVIVPSGKTFFSKDITQVQLDLVDITKVTKDIFQVRYKVIKEMTQID
jgi:dihydrofolate reductase